MGHRQLPLIANLASFGASAACGLLATLLIVVLWSSEAMGIFTQALAWYFVVSQIAVLGLHNASLTFLARRKGGPIADNKTVVTALAMGLVGGVAGALLTNPISMLASLIASNESVGETVRNTALLLVFSTLAKIVLFSLNGLALFYRFALLQALRAAGVLAATLAAWTLGADVVTIPLYMALAEALVLLIGLALIGPAYLRPRKTSLRRMRLLAFFGIGSLPSGVLAEANARVDVVLLGAFVPSATVGVYSTAALLAEGLFNLLLVFRVMLQPQIGEALSRKRAGDLTALFRMWRPRMAALSAVVSLGIAGVIFLAVPVVTAELPPGQTALYFSILAVGITAAAAYLPFSTILLVGGQPVAHGWLFLSIIVVNALGNLALVPFLGAIGAAIGTAIAYSIFAAATFVLAHRYFKVRLW
jgi:O-antigen/teichoic acid export membrane protein